MRRCRLRCSFQSAYALHEALEKKEDLYACGQIDHRGFSQRRFAIACEIKTKIRMDRITIEVTTIEITTVTGLTHVKYTTTSFILFPLLCRFFFFIPRTGDIPFLEHTRNTTFLIFLLDCSRSVLAIRRFVIGSSGSINGSIDIVDTWALLPFHEPGKMTVDLSFSQSCRVKVKWKRLLEEGPFRLLELKSH